MLPTSFGHYRVDGRLGSGGMGEVFLGFDTRLNRPIAIKLLHQGARQQAEVVQRFLTVHSEFRPAPLQFPPGA